MAGGLHTPDIPEFMLAGLGVLVLIADFAVPWPSRGVKNGVLAALTVLGLAVTLAVMLWKQWGWDEPRWSSTST